VTSWIVPFVQKNKDDPRSHTNQHEPIYFRLELDVTFEAKPGQCVGDVPASTSIMGKNANTLIFRQ
jgi:hypothetical protein